MNVRMVDAGQVVQFTYHGKTRHVTIEKVEKFLSPDGVVYVDYFTGFDSTVNGYRSFTMNKVTNLRVL